jgi:hypothetical protein
VSQQFPVSCIDHESSIAGHLYVLHIPNHLPLSTILVRSRQANLKLSPALLLLVNTMYLYTYCSTRIHAFMIFILSDGCLNFHHTRGRWMWLTRMSGMNESGMRFMYYINTPVWRCSNGGPVPVLVSLACIAYIAVIYMSVLP